VSRPCPVGSEREPTALALARRVSTFNRRPRSNLLIRRYGIHRVCAGPSWLAQNGIKDAASSTGSKNPEQYPTKEQQKACLEMAAAELIREITQKDH
jgi:hypothetical protein